MRFMIAILLGISCCVFAQEGEELNVVLNTESRLKPVAIVLVDGGNQGVSSDYLKRMMGILRFDFDHNGSTYVVDLDPTMQKQLSKAPFEREPHQLSQDQLSVVYLIKVQVQDRSLSLRAMSARSERAKALDHFPLEGDISADRRQLHRIADAVHKALFGSEGIASTRILYTVRNPIGGLSERKWRSDVWESDYDGANARQLTSDGGYCVTPTYVPPEEGKRCSYFFFVSYQNTQPKILLASLKKGIGHRFSTLRGNQFMPAITRQRDQVAFVSDAAGNADLFLQAFDPEAGALGKPRQIYAFPGATVGTPSFSPDGKQVAFVSNKDGVPRIYVMEIPPPGTKFRDLKIRLMTKRGNASTAPAWSPDGSKIAYSAKTDGVRQIWTVDVASGEEKQLTTGPGHKENPSWAPNSLHLVYNAGNEESAELYFINLNQGKAARITSGAGEKRFPAWEPRSG